MKRSMHRNLKTSTLPVAWSEDQYATMLANAAASFEDRVSEDIFDFDDERAEIDVIVQRLHHGAN